MAHVAQIVGGIVARVIVVGNSHDDPEAFAAQLLGGEWKRTSYNWNFRGHFAAVGDWYDSDRDIFITPKPFPSWVLNETTGLYEAPVPRPADRFVIWDESTLQWVDPSDG